MSMERLTMWTKLKWALAAVLILSPLVPVGAAVFPSIRGTALELSIKATSALAGCRTGKACLFWDGNTDGPIWKKADGTTVTLGGDGSLPDQTGNSGKYLTTNGTSASWATVSAGSVTGIIDYDEELALGNANNGASGSFAQIGDGASTGFSDWVTASLAAGDYTICYTVNYKVDGTDVTNFRVKIDGSAPTQPVAASLSGTGEWQPLHRCFTATLGSGTHTLRLEWKTSYATAYVSSGQSSRVFEVWGAL